MARHPVVVVCLVSLVVLAGACARTSRVHSQAAPDIRVHYLGHSSFILSFDNGVTVLTDYGESRAYGLDSPVYDLGGFVPTVATYSHHHPDHDRGTAFAGAKVVDGGDLSLDGVDIKAVRVSEKAEDDNCGYLITYEGYTLFHAGDIQGDIVAISRGDEARERIKRRLPARLDLLLVPIDWTAQITGEAGDFVALLEPRAVIPMHYWSPSVKSEFLAELASKIKGCEVLEVGGSDYDIHISGLRVSSIKVISLTPGPPPSASGGGTPMD